jgi:hypothetical protein
MIYLANAFSAGMISSFPADVRFEEITPDEAKRILIRRRNHENSHRKIDL